MGFKNWQGKESQFHPTKRSVHNEEKQENEKKIIKPKEKIREKNPKSKHNRIFQNYTAQIIQEIWSRLESI